MKRKAAPVKLSEEQLEEYDFIKSLTHILENADLSGVSMKELSFGDEIHYSILVNNYQIECGRTPVFYKPNFFSLGEWAFDEKRQLGRYEAYVFEVMRSQYIQDSNDILFGGRIVGRTNSGEPIYRHPGYATAFMNAAMASDKGFYRTHIYDSRPREFFFEQNAHLFPTLSQLFYILNREAQRRGPNFGQRPPVPVKEYDFGGVSLQELRARTLDNIRTILGSRQK